MKKILTLAVVMAVSCSTCFAATTFGKSIKNAVKQDIKNTKKEVKSTNNAIKKAIKSDIENTEKAKTAAATAKKTEKLNQINSKLNELNKEMTTIKNSKEITETERTLRVKALQRQIDFYNKQKAALQ